MQSPFRIRALVALVALSSALAVGVPARSTAQSPGASSSQGGGEETIKATWTAIPGRAKDISINAVSAAYAVGADGVALHWRADVQRWAKLSGAFVRISGAEGNHPWAIDGKGTVMRFNGLWWEAKGDKVEDVAGDAVGNVFIAKRDGEIERWEPLSQAWRRVPGPAARRIALDIRGNPWVVTPQGKILRRDGKTWSACWSR